MNEVLPKTDAGAIKGATSPPPVVATASPGQPHQPAPGNGAAKPTQETRQGNKFQFAVNSAQGQEERREHERQRKQAARAVATRMVEPPPLPPAGTPLPGAQPTPGNNVPPGAGGASDPVSTAIPWTPELIRDMSDELIDAAEDGRRNSLATLAQEGGLPEKAVRKIHADSGYKPAAKRGLQLAVPKITARLMNKTGISSEHSDTLILVSAVAMIWKQSRSLKRDVLELIEANKPKPEAAKPEGKAP